MSESNRSISPSNPGPQTSYNDEEFHSGANWFYWIAGLSLVNSILLYIGTEWAFVIGLGITQLIDGIAMELTKSQLEVSGIIKALALALDILASVIFLFFGWLSNKKNQWAFIVGIVLYFLDGLLFLFVQDWMSIGFHLFALFFMFKGYLSLKNLLKKEGRAEIETSGRGGRSPLLWLTLALVGAMAIIGYVALTPPMQPIDKLNIDSQTELSEFSTYFYKTKIIDLVSSSIAFLDSSSILNDQELNAGMVGFYSEIFRQFPDRLEGWIEKIDTLSNENTKALFCYALWMSGTADGKVYFKREAENAKGEEKEALIYLLSQNPPDLKTIAAVSPEDNDLLWGTFFASGDPVYVVNIINAAVEYNELHSLTEFVTAETAKWSLSSNASAHDLVMDTLMSEREKRDLKARTTIQEIIDKSLDPNGPQSIIDEMEATIARERAKGRWNDEQN